ncbi:hypothetical protein E3N88_17609 [Mikania micrantha]|uniref:Uncharacterized protein n=1 Tax=Mikania micrantha TaxID=192012 RepID=A0A5N6NU55_9ASTR|nr:hypothetical protein E3N88_17609 [Mikania micrantha]
MDKQYSSQPVDKPSKWILSKWRRPNFRNETSPDKCNEMQGEESRSNKTKQPQESKKRKWDIPDDESEKWSKDAFEFFNTGDAPFCYSAVFFKSEKLDKYWSLIMIDLNSLDLVMYNNKRISGDRYRERVHPSLKKIVVYFTALLVNIRYWKVKRRQESNITYGANDDYIRPENEIYGNEGLYFCMLMEHLVTGKPLDLTDGFKQCCTNYRLFMADQIYFWRCLP